MLLFGLGCFIGKYKRVEGGGEGGELEVGWREVEEEGKGGLGRWLGRGGK